MNLEDFRLDYFTWPKLAQLQLICQIIEHGDSNKFDKFMRLFKQIHNSKIQLVMFWA